MKPQIRWRNIAITLTKVNIHHTVNGRRHTRGLRIHDLHTRGQHIHVRGFLRNYGHFGRHLPRRESESHGNESKNPQLQLRMSSNR